MRPCSVYSLSVGDSRLLLCALPVHSIPCKILRYAHQMYSFIHSVVGGHVLVHELAPIHGRQGEPEGADHSRWVGGRFNKQGSSHTRFVLGGYKMGRSLYHPPESLAFI